MSRNFQVIDITVVTEKEYSANCDQKGEKAARYRESISQFGDSSVVDDQFFISSENH